MYVLAFRFVYFEYKETDILNIRIWEDLYGRGLVFFLASTASYLVYSTRNQNISFFELEQS